MHGIEFSPITDDVKKKRKNRTDDKDLVTEISPGCRRKKLSVWFHCHVDASPLENLDNCEPRWRGTGVAIAGSHTNNRGFMMGARYFAPFSSRIASPRLLSLSLSFHFLVSLPRVSREIS